MKIADDYLIRHYDSFCDFFTFIRQEIVFWANDNLPYGDISFPDMEDGIKIHGVNKVSNITFTKKHESIYLNVHYADGFGTLRNQWVKRQISELGEFGVLLTKELQVLNPHIEILEELENKINEKYLGKTIYSMNNRPEIVSEINYSDTCDFYINLRADSEKRQFIDLEGYKLHET